LTPKHIPGTEKPKWISQKALVELVAGLPPFALALIGGYRLVLDEKTADLGYLSFGAAAWLFLGYVLKVWNARYQDKEAAAKGDHDGLRGALCVLHASVGRACNLNLSEEDALRVTFHRVVPPLGEALEIEQIVPYVGGKGGGVGRKNSVRAGITGRCIRMKETLTMHRDSRDEATYRSELAADWGYTEPETRALTSDRMSFMAVPVLDGTRQHALGVVYIDAKQENLFVDEAVQTSIIYGVCRSY
jgi:hypothetical protein